MALCHGLCVPQAAQNTGQWSASGRPACCLVAFGFGGHVATFMPDTTANGEASALCVSRRALEN